MDFLTIKEAAILAKCSADTIRRDFGRGLPFYRVHKNRILIKRRDLEEWLETGRNVWRSEVRILRTALRNTLTDAYTSDIEREEGGEKLATRKKGRLRTIDGVVFIRPYKSGRTSVYIELYNAQDKRVKEAVKGATTLEEGAVILERRAQEERDLKFGIKRLPQIVTFEELADIYEDWARINKRSWRSDISRLKVMRACFGSKFINQLTVQDAERLKKMIINAGAKLSTVNRYVTTFSRILNLAVEWGYLRENPCRGIRKYSEEHYRRTRVLSRDEEERLYKTIKEELFKALKAFPWRAREYERLKSMLTVFLHTGLRRKELFNLEWKDVDFKNSQLYIRETKTARSRYIPLNSTAYNELMKLYPTRSDEGTAFKNPRTGKKYVDIKRSFNTLCETAKIKDFRLHDLRRTFGTRLLESGCDIVTVQHLLGHRDIRTTMIYTMTNQQEKRNAVALLDNQEDPKLARIWPAFQKNGVTKHSSKYRHQWN